MSSMARSACWTIAALALLAQRSQAAPVVTPNDVFLSSASRLLLQAATDCPECVDEGPFSDPGNELGCEQQRGWGKCDEPWMEVNNWCANTCGYCTCGEAAADGAAPEEAAADGAAPEEAAAMEAEPMTANGEPAAGAPKPQCADCTDDTPNEFTCEQQAFWGKCGEPFMASFCKFSCEECAPVCTAADVVTGDSAATPAATSLAAGAQQAAPDAAATPAPTAAAPDGAAMQAEAPQPEASMPAEEPTQADPATPPTSTPAPAAPADGAGLTRVTAPPAATASPGGSQSADGSVAVRYNCGDAVGGTNGIDWENIRPALGQALGTHDVLSAEQEITDVQGSYSTAIYSSGCEGTGPAGLTMTLSGLPLGKHILILHYAELRPTSTPGANVFDVLVDGRVVAESIDVQTLSGGRYKSWVNAYPVVVSAEGGLSVALRPVTGAPLLSALEVVSAELFSASASASRG